MSEDQDLDQFLLDHQVVQAEAATRKAEAEATLAEIDLEKAKLELLHERLNLDSQLNGVYSLDREITAKSARKFLSALHLWHLHDSNAAWRIYLNSIGGSVWEGNAIIDELTAYSLRGGGTHHITIKVRGIAASMASMILQAADTRIIGHHSQLMIHKGETGGHFDVDRLEDEVKYAKDSTEWMVKLFLSRTEKLTRTQLLAKINRRDWWLSSDQAVELGLADGIG